MTAFEDILRNALVRADLPEVTPELDEAIQQLAEALAPVRGSRAPKDPQSEDRRLGGND